MGAKRSQRRDRAAARLIEAAALPCKQHRAQRGDGLPTAGDHVDDAEVAVVK
ncbi:MAG: hypothetical protein ABSA90_03395 [Xanthobacteraceae bacterium]